MMNDEDVENHALEGKDVLLSSSSTVAMPGPSKQPPRGAKTNNGFKKNPLPPVPPLTHPLIEIKKEILPIPSLPENICPLCKRDFKRAHNLMIHLTTCHSGQPSFDCAKCHKKYKLEATLISHQKTHDHEERFNCELCNKSFLRKNTLNAHRLTHSGSKPFQCNVCPKSFYQKGNLKNHMNIHTNARPFKCNVCLRGFNQKSNLVCHKKNVHLLRVDATVNCQYCEMQFNSGDDLANHELEIHARPSANNLAFSPMEIGGDQVDPMLDIEVVIKDESLDLSVGTPLCPKIEPPASQEAAFAPDALPPGQRSNCQMVFERTEDHVFFSKFHVIHLPQRIDTLEMRYAVMTKKIPFAMLHFGNEPPCLVEIIQQDEMSTLRPIRKHELKKLSFFALDPKDVVGEDKKIVITIVATIYHSFANGDSSLFTITSPEVVRLVKILLDPELKPLLPKRMYATELQELRSKVTICMNEGAEMVTPKEEDAVQCKREPMEN